MSVARDRLYFLLMLADIWDQLWRLEGAWAILGDLHKVLPPPIVGLVVTAAGVLCGTLVGAERERRQKPAGMRTLALICLGAVIFTQASILLSKDGTDRTRIAAQVVTGIGFLGAGTIIRDRGTVIGETTAASIWTVAAIGILIGAGYVVAGVGLTIIVLAMLVGVGGLEHWAMGPCRRGTMRIVARRAGGKTGLLIRGQVEQAHATVIRESVNPANDTIEMIVAYCRAHQHHGAYIAGLAALPEILEMIELTAEPQTDAPKPRLMETPGS